MGCFSWLFADQDNKRALHMGNVGYLICPDGTVYACNHGYDGYGRFGDHDCVDAYEAVASWNREYLSQHPEFEIPQHGSVFDESTASYILAKPKKVSEFAWWPFYSDLSLSPEEVELKMKSAPGYLMRAWEYRWIGIDISCYDDQNRKLPYPIKVSSVPNVRYEDLPASDGDPNQGFRSWELD